MTTESASSPRPAISGAPPGPDPSRLDWAGAWRAAHARRPPHGPEAWDTRAPSFGGDDSSFAAELMPVLDPDPTWTVLDVGCGSGALAVPLAARTAAVTALDFSSGMLAVLGGRCAAAGVTNVTLVRGAWDVDWRALGVGEHDLVVASRSLVVADLRGGLEKLDAFARHRVCVVAMVGEGPHDHRIASILGRPAERRPDYLVVYGMLHSMGIYADVRLVARHEWRVYASPEAAVAAAAFQLPGLDPAERATLARHFERTLVPCDGGLRMPEPRLVRWAAISWSKSAAASTPNLWHPLHAARAAKET